MRDRMHMIPIVNSTVIIFPSQHELLEKATKHKREQTMISDCIKN